jgi:HSP20 family protein
MSGAVPDVFGSLSAKGVFIMGLPTRVNRLANMDPVEAMQREFDTVLGRFLTGGGSNNGGRLAPYGVDVREDNDHVYVEAELPGFRKDEINITLENQTLTIAAERGEANEDGKKGELLLNERCYTRYLRSFTLPPTVNEQTVNAKLNDGVLTITLDKREESKPRKVTIA